MKLHSVAEYAKKRKTSKSTIYSWIAKKQTTKNGFKVIEIGTIKLIKPIKK